MIKASKFEYKGEFRIKVEMPYNEENIKKVKKVRDAKWSFNLKTWHIPYDKESFETLKSLFPDIVYPQREKEENNKEESKFNHNEIQIKVTSRKILICMRKDSNDIDFIKSLKYSRWNNNTFQWEVSNWGNNLQRIREHFSTRITSFDVDDLIEKEKNHQKIEVKEDEITIIQTNKGRLKLLFRYDKEFTGIIKTFRYKSWDETNKWWTLPYSEFNLKEILRYARERNKKINFEKEELVKTIQPRIPKEDVPNYRECPLSYKQKLIEKRYSTNTQKTYISHFEEFINYYY
ncbi:MAG: hypothetical protein IH594_15800, partial [Bacteroidales bacterium]|nr:hypothetical protein [Bacteroidales bacterium]